MCCKFFGDFSRIIYEIFICKKDLELVCRLNGNLWNILANISDHEKKFNGKSLMTFVL